MKRKFRLRKSTEVKRVRRLGKSYAHPLIVLIRHPNDQGFSRFAVSSGRSVGNAVRRNRAKRRIREILRLHQPAIQSGWDILILARKPINRVSFQELEKAIHTVLARAGLLR